MSIPTISLSKKNDNSRYSTQAGETGETAASAYNKDLDVNNTNTSEPTLNSEVTSPKIQKSEQDLEQKDLNENEEPKILGESHSKEYRQRYATEMNTYAASSLYRDYNFGGYVPPMKKSQMEIPKSFFSSHKPIKILTSQITTQKEMFTRSIGRSPIFNSSADAGVEKEALAQPRMSFSSSSKKALPFSLITRNHKVNKNL